MTITIQLDGPQLAQLQREAASLGVPVERMAETIIRRQLDNSSPVDTISDDEFRKAKEATFREYDELYRRLAK
ncbi:MAG: hypothetical protein WCL32_00590 [Planctomycetota bacterium]